MAKLNRFISILTILASFVLIVQAGETEGDNSNTVLLLHFNKIQGNKVLDSSSYANHGLLLGLAGISLVEGISGSGIKFHGSPSIYGHIEVPNSPSLNLSVFTIEAWVKLGKLPEKKKAYYVVRKSGQYYLEIYRNKFQFIIKKGEEHYRCVAPQEIHPEIGKWTHWVCTFDGEEMALYLDGDLKAKKIIDDESPIEATKSPVFIGVGFPMKEKICFNGVIDEVKILKVVLTPEEIRKRYEEIKKEAWL